MITVKGYCSSIYKFIINIIMWIKKKYIKPEITVKEITVKEEQKFNSLSTEEQEKIKYLFLNRIIDNIYSLRTLYNCELSDFINVIFIYDNNKIGISINRCFNNTKITCYIVYRGLQFSFKDIIYDVSIPIKYTIRQSVVNIFK